MCRPPAASPTTGSRSTRPACRRAWRSENSCERAMDEREPASGEEGDGEPIPLSALQHAVYCLRQAALIHLERLWAENRFTAEGRVLHLAARSEEHTSELQSLMRTS